MASLCQPDNEGDGMLSKKSALNANYLSQISGHCCLKTKEYLKYPKSP